MSFSKILYDNRLADATPVASTTAAGYSVLNLRDWKPYTWWKPTALPATITVDCGVARAADYALIYGHTLHDAQVAVEVRGSTDNFAASDDLISHSNLFAFPEDFADTYWTKESAPVITSNAARSPNGSFEADKIDDQSVVQRSAVSKTITVQDDSLTRYISVSVLKKSIPDFTALFLRYTGGTNKECEVRLNTATGQTGLFSGAPSAFGAEDLGDHWRFYCALANNASGNTGLFIIIVPQASSSLLGADDVTITGYQHFFGAQLKRDALGYYEGALNTQIYLPFTSASYRYWRLRFVQLTGAVMPQIAIASVGEALAVPEGLPNGFDPRGREPQGRVNRSGTGIPLGSIVDWNGWSQQVRFELITWDWERNVFEPAYNAHLAHTPFGFAWDPTDHADEIYLVNCDGFQAPHRPGGYCDLSLNLSAAV